jgi:Type II secretion system (T2SS), protein E, N-terminal domain
MMEKMQETALDEQNYLIPHMRDLRRIPMRYQRILPLKVMKEHQCVVVGAARGVLTVAITDRYNSSSIKALTKLIGHPIFPVRVKPARIDLLIKRMERWVLRKDEILRWPRIISSFEIHMVVGVLTA